MARRNHSRRSRAVRRQRQNSICGTSRENLTALRNWFLPDGVIFAKLRFHGNTSWLPVSLVWLAVFWSWSVQRNLTDAFDDALGCCRRLSIPEVPGTFQGFMGALVHWTDDFMQLLFRLLQARMEDLGSEFWRVGRWVPIAFDGSRSSAPRTKKNEKTLRPAHYGHGKTSRYRKKKTQGMRRRKNEKNKPQLPQPQAWITLMWHMALRLPWSWRLGPSNSSERAHVIEMLEQGEFPENTLFCGDAGFVGYPLWSEILQCGGDFLVRVGSNVNLLLEVADYRRDDDLVLCWPKAVMQAGQPPLRLRLVRVRIGATRVWMLTSVTNAAQLTNKQIVRLYKMRWGIEIEFRGLKQTLDRAKLRSRNDQRLFAELHWSLMGMAIAELWALKEQLSHHRSPPQANHSPYNPVKRSLAQTIRAIRNCLRNLPTVAGSDENLSQALRIAVTDDYQRTASKHARYRPPNPDKKPLGDPQLRKITRNERKLLAETESTIAA
jgi:Transposase DDE domain